MSINAQSGVTTMRTAVRIAERDDLVKLKGIEDCGETEQTAPHF